MVFFYIVVVACSLTICNPSRRFDAMLNEKKYFFEKKSQNLQLS